MSASADRESVRRSARQIGWWIGIASAVVIAAGVGILVAVILSTSRPDGDGRGGRSGQGRGGDLDHVVVDVDRVLPWVLVLGVLGVVLLGLVAWFAARRAVAPLARALQAQRDFVADASHELRTPLTALSSRVQIAQRRLARGEPVDDALERLRRDTLAMDAVLTELLVAAQADRGVAGPTEAAEAAPAIDAAVELIRPLAEEAGVVMRGRAVPGLVVGVPAVTLTRLCTALLDNAVQHAPAGSAVELSAQNGAGGMVDIRVADRGPGVRAEDRERIFTRFGRGPESGRRRGFGLGLALVRDVALRYGGGVDIETTSSDGTVFLLRLPAHARP
ncbi:sensor histidine kinase KdpD [uncultured Microbacterium sp.]|uniref:sensor histidine kinase n=1 Tax=uncultured Microbacterium sp. TaxID=191216 RepID=UPI0025F40D53|nr:HAMP domain-containing sensor histidine kinase [uncultured Microbacterium sp.]